MSSEPTEEYNGPMFGGHDIMYLKIAAGLAILTIFEVALSYTSLKKAALALPLLAMALVKFIVVAGYFMHLKFDTPVFRRLFTTGAILALFCYIAMLSAFGSFKGSFHWIALAVFTIVSIAVFMVREYTSDGHGDGHADDTHADHGHADTSHAAH